MAFNTWLNIGVSGIPLIGALLIWRLGSKFLPAQRWLATSIFGIMALVAVASFLLNRQYACVIASGGQNCLFDGLASLSLFVLNLVLLERCIIPRGIDKEHDYMLMLLLSSTWAGIGLAMNLLQFIMFLYLFAYVINRWMKKKGFTWSILLVRDDYGDHPK